MAVRRSGQGIIIVGLHDVANTRTTTIILSILIYHVIIDNLECITMMITIKFKLVRIRYHNTRCDSDEKSRVLVSWFFRASGGSWGYVQTRVYIYIMCPPSHVSVLSGDASSKIWKRLFGDGKLNCV